MILGAPARVMRDLNPEEISALKQSAAIYVAISAGHPDALSGWATPVATRW